MKTLLVALNARYSHTNLAVRVLRAYACDPSRTPPEPPEDLEIHETHINQPMAGVVRDLAAARAMYGFSCYLWNIEEVAADLRVCAFSVGCYPAACGPEIAGGEAGLLF
jgi:hypothetical protein